jgi:hypothetical protein
VAAHKENPTGVVVLMRPLALGSGDGGRRLVLTDLSFLPSQDRIIISQSLAS